MDTLILAVDQDHCKYGFFARHLFCKNLISKLFASSLIREPAVVHFVHFCEFEVGIFTIESGRFVLKANIEI